MDTVVVKKDGRRQKFDRRKIERALSRAGVRKGAERIASSIEKRLAGKSEVSSGTIREMVASELQALDRRLEEAYLNFRKAVRKLTQGEQFLENRLAEIVGENGEVKCVYGGFHIYIRNPDMFDYSGVFHELLAAKHTVRVELSEGRLRIVTK